MHVCHFYLLFVKREKTSKFGATVIPNRMASNLSAQELLALGDDDRKTSLLTQYWPEIVGITLGLGAASFINFQTRRPWYSGVQKHIVLAGGLTGILEYVQRHRLEYFAEKDAVFRDYIKQHPEDFPVPVRRKIADIMEPWIPIR